MSSSDVVEGLWVIFGRRLLVTLGVAELISDVATLIHFGCLSGIIGHLLVTFDVAELISDVVGSF